MDMLLHILVGGILGAVFVAIAKSMDRKAELGLHAFGIIVAGLIYMAFAPSSWMTIEIIGTIVIGGIAVIGAMKSPGLVSVAWILHALWDLILHVVGKADWWTPDWYGVGCIGFDVVCALGLALPRK